MIEMSWEKVVPMSLLASGDVASVVTTDLGKITPATYGKVDGLILLADTAVTQASGGTSVRGVLAFERNGVEIITWQITTMPAGTWLFWPINIDASAKDTYVLTVKTATAADGGAASSGNVRAFVVGGLPFERGTHTGTFNWA